MSYIVYNETSGKISFHQYIGTQGQVEKLCSVNPGLTYMPGKCHERHCKVDVSTTPHTVLHNQDLIPAIALIRQRRNLMMKASDWTQGADSPLSDSQKAEWQTYRQSLRDIPSSYADETDMNNVIWPSEPS